MRSRFVLAAAISFAAFALVACSNPKATIIPDDPGKWEIALKDVMTNLPKADQEVLGAYLVRVKIEQALRAGAGVPPGMTVERALDDQKDFKRKEEEKAAEAKLLKDKKDAEEKALKAEVVRKRADAQQRFDDAIVVTLVSKSVRPADYRTGSMFDKVLYTVAFRNKGSKDMMGVKGQGKFTDIFGDEIKTINFSYDRTIAAGQDASVDYSTDTLLETKLKDTPQDKLKFVFTPEVILYADGSKLEMPSDKPATTP